MKKFKILNKLKLKNKKELLTALEVAFKELTITAITKNANVTCTIFLKCFFFVLLLRSIVNISLSSYLWMLAEKLIC